MIEALNCAKHYVANFEELRIERQNSIALLGVTGAGKTHLLSAVGNNLLAKGFSVMYFPHVEGFDDLKSDFDLLEQKRDLMKTCDALFWDDLYKGRERPTDFQLDTIFNVVNYRYLHNKPILLSSEKDIDELCDIDSAIGGRIYEMTKSHLVNIKPRQNEPVRDYNFRMWRGV